MTGLHLDSGRMKRQFIHIATPEPLILLTNYLLHWKWPLCSPNEKNIAAQRSPQLHQVPSPEKLRKTYVMFCWWLTVKPALFVCFARWSCGAGQRSASKKQLKRSLSQEQSAIIFCVMWPTERRFTSKPRWFEKRYTGVNIYRIFVLAHSEPLFFSMMLLCLLCMYVGSELLSHLVYRLHFYCSIWMRARTTADSSGAAQLYHVMTANRNARDPWRRSFSSLCFLILGWRCYNISEQCSCSPWEKSDGQRWWRPPQIPTHQHHGTVLGKTCRN